MSKAVIWTQQEIDTIKKYYEKEGSDIQKRLPDKPYSAIKRKANSLGIFTKRINRPKSSYTMGESRFNNGYGL